MTYQDPYLPGPIIIEPFKPKKVDKRNKNMLTRVSKQPKYLVTCTVSDLFCLAKTLLRKTFFFLLYEVGPRLIVTLHTWVGVGRHTHPNWGPITMYRRVPTWVRVPSWSLCTKRMGVVVKK